jgi:hypothetical protein
MQPFDSSMTSSSVQVSIAAALQDVAVDAEIAELVDDQRDALAVGVLEHVADQRGLAGAEKAGDDGGGDLRGHATAALRFQRLRLNGFKSFVDPTDLVIADGLTGVVGPNGCGKSNLLEALRWVMGENRPPRCAATGWRT